jgi:hypothetical protein
MTNGSVIVTGVAVGLEGMGDGMMAVGGMDVGRLDGPAPRQPLTTRTSMKITPAITLNGRIFFNAFTIQITLTSSIFQS